MAFKTQTAQTRTAIRTDRPTFTLELATAICPDDGLASRLSRVFGIEPVDFDDIADATKAAVIQSSNALTDNLSEKAMEIHLQRIVGSFVGSACGAGEFYGQKVSQAREVSTRLSNDDRDEDRDGPAGFDSRGERVRMFAAQMGLQAFALLAAAKGAVDAYRDVIGSDWKPFTAPQMAHQSVARQSAATELSAFERG